LVPFRGNIEALYFSLKYRMRSSYFTQMC